MAFYRVSAYDPVSEVLDWYVQLVTDPDQSPRPRREPDDHLTALDSDWLTAEEAIVEVHRLRRIILDDLTRSVEEAKQNLSSPVEFVTDESGQENP